jgi:predicted transposase YbfD/YdcC
MTDAATGLEVVFETAVFLHYFSNLPDSRQPGKVVYPLNEVLLLSLLAVLAGAESLQSSPASARNSLPSCAGSSPLPMERRRMKADYILALKGNQGTLREDVEVFANEQKVRDFQDTTISTHKTAGADHGRIETRNYTLIHDTGWLQERHKWPSMKRVLMVESQREYNGKVERETRFYITSSTLEAQTLSPMIRSHWAIENSLHWVMDMTFRDDECRIRTGHAPANFTTLRHMAHNLVRKAPGKDSLRLRRKTAAWDDDYLATLIAA